MREASAPDSLREAIAPDSLGGCQQWRKHFVSGVVEGEMVLEVDMAGELSWQGL